MKILYSYGPERIGGSWSYCDKTRTATRKHEASRPRGVEGVGEGNLGEDNHYG